MKYWERFTSFKQRGEWVELRFMAQAAKRRFAVSKPWGETQAYDVGIEPRTELSSSTGEVHHGARPINPALAAEGNGTSPGSGGRAALKRGVNAVE
jgi:hypothetical protein